MRVIPIAKLNSETLENILIEATPAIVDAGGIPVALICDNCATNQGVYNRLGGPGKIYMEGVGIKFFIHMTMSTFSKK